jgi:hypothetical protein
MTKVYPHCVRSAAPPAPPTPHATTAAGERPRRARPPPSTRLLAARCAFDAVAAARVAPTDGQDLVHIRGGRPSQAQWQRALRVAATGDISPDRFRDHLRRALADLPDGGELTIVEAGVKGVTVTHITENEFGLPRPRRYPTVPWERLVPTLATGPRTALPFRLAGGLGETDHHALWAELRRNLAERVQAPPGGQVARVCTAPGWPVPERALSELPGQTPPDPPFRLAGVDVDEVVDDAVATAPLRTHVELVVAEVDPRTGEVRPYSTRLFDAGAPVDDRAHLRVRCVHPPEDGIVLATMTWRHGEPWVLSISSVRLPAGTHRLDARLLGGGQVEFVEPPGVKPDRRRWSELVAGLPRRLTPEVTDLDVVCLVDRCGDGFEARRALATDFVQLVERRFPGPGQLRVAVLAYGRHDFRLEAEGRSVLSGCWLGPPTAALDVLATLDPVRPDRVACSPLEDALHATARRLPSVPAGRRVVVLTLGDQPPHPHRDGPEGLLPCPDEHNWHTLLRRIEKRPGVSGVVVLDSFDSVGPAWRRIGRAGLLRLDRTDAHELAAVTRVVAPESDRLALPLLDSDN